MSEAGSYYRHGLRPMHGRDRQERRAASPLELLYDLTFVAAFGVAGNELAHAVAAAHWQSGVIAYAFTMITIVWAWTNFSWFASAFDTDDWLFRLLTMVQMIGVVILALGIADVFSSFEHHAATVDNSILIAGYVVMRVALVLQWLRAGFTNSRYRAAAASNALFITVGQIGWVTLAVLHVTTTTYVLVGIVLFAIELTGPIVAERRGERSGGATPWHPHHIAERYSLLTIIALGETVLGTLSAATEIIDTQGWSGIAITVVITGMLLALTLWWSYFLIPSAPVISHNRRKGYIWGYGHIPIFVSTAAIGAGLHTIGYAFEEDASIDERTIVIAIAVPVLLYGVSAALLQTWLLSGPPRSSALQASSFLFPVAAIIAAGVGVPLWGCLLLVAAAPASVAVGYEAGGWRTLTQQLDEVLAHAAPSADGQRLHR